MNDIEEIVIEIDDEDVDFESYKIRCYKFFHLLKELPLNSFNLSDLELSIVVKFPKRSKEEMQIIKRMNKLQEDFHRLGKKLNELRIKT